MRAESGFAWKYGWLLCIALLWPASVWAQQDENAAAVRALEREVASLSRDAEAARTSEQRTAVLARARDAHGKASALQDTLGAPVAEIEQRIAQLGEDAAESPDNAVRRQYVALNRELAARVALSRRTALAEVEALQTLNRLTGDQARAIGAELFERTESPLTADLWQRGGRALAKDLSGFLTPGGRPDRAGVLWLFAGALLVWSLLTWWLSAPIGRQMRRTMIWWTAKSPPREVRFHKALLALGTILVAVLAPAITATLLFAALQLARPSELLSQSAAIVTLSVMAALFARAVAWALFQPGHGDWRLVDVDDAGARQGVAAGSAIGWTMAVVLAVEATITRLELGDTSQLALHSALALLSAVLLAFALRAAGRIRRREGHVETPDAGSGIGLLTLCVGLGWLALAVLALAGMLGFVNFANRMSQWAVWGAGVIATTWVLMAFVDGACRLLATAGPGHRRSVATRRALEQAAVLLSAVARLLLIFLACGALLVPFGAGFVSVFESLGALADGFEIGGVTVSAAAVFRAALAFLVVVALVRFIRTWIVRSYLPTTTLQPDARDSVDKILRYVGLLLAVLWALTAFGVGMEKVAILASALSVGIGFGLQAITQNFVSGLILLVERPVKIGDWVKLNDVEGDIRRINVRSTEIQIADHSTVIVPNSELITKVVQNKTKGNSLGRAQILLSIPLESDLDAAIDVVAATLAADSEVLKTPAPGVFIDRIENGMAVLNCFVHVVSPRQAYGVRSRLIRATLRALKTHDIPVTLPPQQFVLTPAPPG